MYLFLFLAALGLHIAVLGLPLIVESGSYSQAAMRGLLIAVTSLVEHKL